MAKTDVMWLLAVQLRVAGIRDPEREYVFARPRRWRFDFAWVEEKVALEVDGGTFAFGRHVTGVGYRKDAEKYNEAVALGWKVLRATPEMIHDRAIVPVIERCLNPVPEARLL